MTSVYGFTIDGNMDNYTNFDSESGAQTEVEHDNHQETLKPTTSVEYGLYDQLNDQIYSAAQVVSDEGGFQLTSDTEADTTFCITNSESENYNHGDPRRGRGRAKEHTG